MKRDPREFIKEGNRRRLEIHIKNDSCRALLQFKDAIKLLLVAWRPDDSTTSCKNVETLSWKKRPFLLQIAPDHRSVRYNILTSLLPPIQTCSSMFWVWSCIASNFDKGWRGDHKHKIMDRPFMPKYGTVSQVLLQLVVSFKVYFNKRFPRLKFPKRRL